MPFFPQFPTGSTAQYPMTTTRRSRTVVNQMPDGSRWSLGDAGAAGMMWELQFAGLSDLEWAALRDFFETCEGRLHTFTFLDPADNLLSSSEDLQAAAWSNDPLIQLSARVADPLGTTRATRVANTGQVGQRVRQSLSAPGSYHYCFSFYGRSASPERVTMHQAADGAVVSEPALLTNVWRRYCCSGTPGSPAETVAFALEVGAGAAVELFGLQVEAQPGAGAYKRTVGAGGVHARARFADDTIQLTSTHVDSHSAIVRIETAMTN